MSGSLDSETTSPTTCAAVGSGVIGGGSALGE
jgi:hypothetical protein